MFSRPHTGKRCGTEEAGAEYVFCHTSPMRGMRNSLRGHEPERQSSRVWPNQELSCKPHLPVGIPLARAAA
ncbi:unnamed protein product [Gemmataceae bacterium]|nr:unnamed protein product [Gemmataceae bacterium]VTT98216.1 unnamed protein product [Gemmataceae bacterium]